MTEREGRK